MANDPRSPKHADPARPDDPGHPDPAPPSADHPAQQKADQVATSESGGRRQMTSDQGPTHRQHIKNQQRGWQPSSDQQQLTDYRRGKHRQRSATPSKRSPPSDTFGDPSPSDENPQPLPDKPQRS